MNLLPLLSLLSFAVWTKGHGGTCGPAATSTDGGKTWQSIDDRFPAAYTTWKNCPTIYRMRVFINPNYLSN